MAALASLPSSIFCHHWVKALLQDWAKSVLNGVLLGSKSSVPARLFALDVLLWIFTPCTVSTSGQPTCVSIPCGSMPSTSSPVVVITFIEEPGASVPVSAMSLLPELLAMARIAPVDGRSTTSELRGSSPTAAVATASMAGSMVVLTTAVLTGSASLSAEPETILPLASSSATSRPAVPCLAFVFCFTNDATVCSALCELSARFPPSASVTRCAPGVTASATGCTVALTFGATRLGSHLTYQPPSFV